MKNARNEDSNVVKLTEELYRNIIGERSEEIMELKAAQTKSTSTIKSQISELKRLKLELKQLKNTIRMSKRALRSEKRKLYDINISLKYEKNLIIDLNESFVSNNAIIDISEYQSKTR